MREIAKASNMSFGAIYHYIGTKEDVLHFITEYTSGRQQALSDYYETLNKENPIATLKKTFSKYLQICNDDQDLLLFVNRDIKSFPKSDLESLLNTQVQVISIFEEVIRSGIKSNVFVKHDPRLLAFDIVSICHQWASWRWYLSQHYSINSYFKEHLDYIIKSIKVSV